MFTLQKKIVGIIVGVKPRNPCGSLFARLEILLLPCDYMFSLMNFVLNNQETLKTSSAVLSINVRNINRIHRSVAKLSSFQLSIYSAGIEMVSSLPCGLNRFSLK